MIRRSIRSLFIAIERIGTDAADVADVRDQKRMLLAIVSMVIPAGIVWGSLYIVFGEHLAGSIPLVYSAASALTVVLFGVTHNYGLFRFSQLLLILLLPFLLMVALGGFVSGSAVILWGMLSPIGALLLAGRRQALAWFLAFFGLVVVSGALEPFIDRNNGLPSNVAIAFFAMNVSTVSLTAFGVLHYSLRLLAQERERSERLLLNVLPAEIALILKHEDRTIADEFDSVSILFADMVGSTVLANSLSPIQLVDLLNDVFSHFDTLVGKHGLEKIQTIGDSFMVASGVPKPRADHAQAIARLALDMIAYLSDTASKGERNLQFRIGINSGPAVAGVIGRTKFHYDIWGDAVNTASRMESHGEPGKIQITRTTYDLIKDEFECLPRGAIEVKGKGMMNTWFLQGPRSYPS